MALQLIHKLSPLVTLDNLWASVTADQLVKEVSNTFCWLRWECFCFWPLTHVVGASDYESITPWSQLQGSNQVNTNPSRIVLIIVMNIYIIKWVISHALPSYIIANIIISTGCMQTHLFQTSFTGMGCSFFGAFIRRGLYLWQTWHVSV